MTPLLGPDYRPLLGIETGLATGIVLMICAGLIVGVIARFVTPGRAPGGLTATLAIGAIGAVALGLLGRSLGWYGSGESFSVLAATLGASYGIYGPAFELVEHEPREPGSEEYRNSEKYEIRHRDHEASHSLRPLLTRLNEIRRANVALHANDSLAFHDTDNPHLLCYSKASADRSNVILLVVNLDPVHQQAGWVTVNLAALGLPGEAGYSVHDLLSGRRFDWWGARNFVQLTPSVSPAHIFRVDRGQP